jgi:hypothetical protein
MSGELGGMCGSQVTVTSLCFQQPPEAFNPEDQDK